MFTHMVCLKTGPVHRQLVLLCNSYRTNVNGCYWNMCNHLFTVSRTCVPTTQTCQFYTCVHCHQSCIISNHSMQTCLLCLYFLQVMLLEEAPFEALGTTNELPVKKKLAKETKAKNITFIPVPDSGTILSCSNWDAENGCIQILENHGMEFKIQIFQACKVMESDIYPGKSWKIKQMVFAF